MATFLADLLYPLQVENGNLKLATNDQVIRQHIISWLQTEPGERVMRQLYGTENYLFENKSSWDVTGIDLQRALTREIPQAEFKVTIAPNDQGDLLITIFWATETEQPPIELVTPR